MQWKGKELKNVTWSLPSPDVRNCFSEEVLSIGDTVVEVDLAVKLEVACFIVDALALLHSLVFCKFPRRATLALGDENEAFAVGVLPCEEMGCKSGQDGILKIILKRNNLEGTWCIRRDSFLCSSVDIARRDILCTRGPRTVGLDWIV